LSFIFCDPGCFFENRASVFGTRAQNHVDSSLLHHGVGGPGDSGVSEKTLNIAKAARRFVQQVFGISVAINAASHAHVMPLDSKFFSAIGERERDLRKSYGLACIGAVEDHVRHLVAAERFGRLLAERPLYGVEHIGFSAAVRADYRRDALMKIEDGFIGKRFEAE
jgi:hypothetical protein